MSRKRRPYGARGFTLDTISDSHGEINMGPIRSSGSHEPAWVELTDLFTNEGYIENATPLQ